MSYWVFFRWTTRYDSRNSEPVAGDVVSRPLTSLPAWRRSDPKHRPMICVPQDSRRHALYIAHQAGLRPPSTSKSPLQLNQSSPALICPPEDRRCTPNQDRKLIRDNPKPRRSSFTFAAAIDCNSIRRQTGARALRASDNFLWSAYSRINGLIAVRRNMRYLGWPTTTFAAILSFSYTVKRMARRKRAGLFPAYAYPPQADGSGSTRRYVRRLLAGLSCSLEHGNVSLTLLRFRVSVAKRTSRPSGEHPVSPSRSGNCIASPFRAIAFHAAAGCLIFPSVEAAAI